MTISELFDIYDTYTVGSQGFVDAAQTLNTYFVIVWEGDYYRPHKDGFVNAPNMLTAARMAEEMGLPPYHDQAPTYVTVRRFHDEQPERNDHVYIRSTQGQYAAENA